MLLYVQIGHDSIADGQQKSKKNSSNIPRQLAECMTMAALLQLFSYFYSFVADSVTDQPQNERECASSRTDLPYESAPSPVTLNKGEQAMEFIKDVKNTLRTPFRSERPIQIQGDKTGLTKKAQHGSVLPEFKVSLYCF